MINKIKFDCIHFTGHIPCAPNKIDHHECDTCNQYKPISKHILIIKLGAIGDVIRTSPIIVKYRSMYPGCHISWITHFPDILPQSQVDTIYKFEFNSVYILKNKKFDIALNLGKEAEACILLKDVSAKEKYGFIWNDSHIDIATPAAGHKLITGLFDRISKANRKHYLDEIFEICDLQFNNEPYLIDVNKDYEKKWGILKDIAGNKPVIGLNTGCGKRWSARSWPKDYWIKLINDLQDNNFFPILLGGILEDEFNHHLSNQTGAYYPGHYSLTEFIALTSNCDMVITQVTMMMHIVTALKIPLILMNNIFNKHEFFLYDNGMIVEPSTGCDCYFGHTCKRTRSCMNDILPETIFENVKAILKPFPQNDEIERSKASLAYKTL
jgi:ADP-heptose:LPS heptosyltransferase